MSRSRAGSSKCRCISQLGHHSTAFFHILESPQTSAAPAEEILALAFAQTGVPESFRRPPKQIISNLSHHHAFSRKGRTGQCLTQATQYKLSGNRDVGDRKKQLYARAPQVALAEVKAIQWSTSLHSRRCYPCPASR